MALGHKTGSRLPGSLSKTTLKMRDLAGQHAPAAIETIISIMQHGTTEGLRLSAACPILDRALGRPTTCTETGNDDDILFANLFANGPGETDEARTA
ncbi:hypothetical protein F4827_000258 [Paraburkholderia bannensis]|uniref:Uncharacterized protein n=1 Tax=Paraburkholderia bannensis TaxID=765414 RepID=A0A7W9WQD8_9BURK|nr:MULTISPECIES: hypothetical protein [Paraburkholderia]MBB3255535.1 hypothetical protein [Paraburkholderia sp. WP4_3_2]MBB6100454.1 hypothetical protein [Paraburkholderia bannensis]